jgi:hypothetical protein
LQISNQAQSIAPGMSAVPVISSLVKDRLFCGKAIISADYLTLKYEI